MKEHKFWAMAMVICMIMTIYTGHHMFSKKTEEEA